MATMTRAMVKAAGTACPEAVIKRGGTRQGWDGRKLRRALNRAFREVHGDKPDLEVEITLELVARRVEEHFKDEVVGVEDVQDQVEWTLMGLQRFREAKRYILYRRERELARRQRKHMPRSAVAEYTHQAKYARYREQDHRREVYYESVERVFGMFLDDHPEVRPELEFAARLCHQKRVLPSMRVMQFAGQAIEDKNARGYNCCFSFCDRIEFFSQAFYLLLCGCGVGFSVQRHHVAQLPPLAQIDRTDVRHHVVEDSIEGWADAALRLFDSYLRGYYVEFAYHEVREQGAPLRTSGGKAPGHLPLKCALERIRTVLDGAQGRCLRTIEAYDAMCHLADAVLAGGIRRSAMIALFSPDDEEMITAKVGDWYKTHPWRARTNNSAVFVRGEAEREQFDYIIKHTQEWGDPGFVFLPHTECGVNPCAEVIMDPRLEVEEEHIMRLRANGVPSAEVGDTLTGFSFCNLSEANAAKARNKRELLEALEAAAIIGTVQATYTDFPYLGPVSELVAERDALIGVSMTGMMDNPDLSLDPEVQREGAELVKAMNSRLAGILGINSAARCCLVKPSGTAALELGCVAPGIHCYHSRLFFRRVIANREEPVYQYFKSINPHMCEQINETDDIITFCVEAPEGAIVKGEVSAVEFLDMVRETMENWVMPGTQRPEALPGGWHNVSNTVHVRENEWDGVANYLWEHRNIFSGVSFLPYDGDKKYANAPYEAVVTSADEEKWNYLVDNYTPVDWTRMVELEDNTDLQGEIACAGGACEI